MFPNPTEEGISDLAFDSPNLAMEDSRIVSFLIWDQVAIHLRILGKLDTTENGLNK